jgi:DNA-directed RNA polymerase specialized sigma24 family protein
VSAGDGRQAATGRHKRDVVEQHATKLSSDHRAVLIAAADGATYTEISVTLKLPFGTVKSRLHRATKVLDRIVAAAEHKAPPPGFDGEEEATYDR